MWQCGERSTFFLSLQRTELLTLVSQYQTPSLSLLLYGNDSFSLEINEAIFVHNRFKTFLNISFRAKRWRFLLSVTLVGG